MKIQQINDGVYPKGDRVITLTCHISLRDEAVHVSPQKCLELSQSRDGS